MPSSFSLQVLPFITLLPDFDEKGTADVCVAVARVTYHHVIAGRPEVSYSMAKAGSFTSLHSDSLRSTAPEPSLTTGLAHRSP